MAALSLQRGLQRIWITREPMNQSADAPRPGGYAEAVVMLTRAPALLLLAPVLLMSCGEKEYTPEELCAGEGPTSLILGGGSGEDFVPFEAGEETYITIAPQGGYGVTIRAQTTGLLTNAPAELVLSSYVDGELTGTFDWGQIPLYCQSETGNGLLWGAVVPFDPEIFPTEEDLEVLDGETVLLVVEATGYAGDVATGEIEVVTLLRD